MAGLGGQAVALHIHPRAAIRGQRSQSEAPSLLDPQWLAFTSERFASCGGEAAGQEGVGAHACAVAGRRCCSEPRQIARRTRVMVYMNHTDIIPLESVSNVVLCVLSPPMHAGEAVKRAAPRRRSRTLATHAGTHRAASLCGELEGRPLRLAWTRGNGRERYPLPLPQGLPCCCSCWGALPLLLLMLLQLLLLLLPC